MLENGRSSGRPDGVLHARNSNLSHLYQSIFDTHQNYYLETQQSDETIGRELQAYFPIVNTEQSVDPIDTFVDDNDRNEGPMRTVEAGRVDFHSVVNTDPAQ